LAGLSVAGQIEESVAALVFELVEVVLELILGIAGQVAEPDLIDPRRELEKGNDAEAALDVAVPERFQAGDVLLVALRPTHLLTIVGPHPRFHQAWPMARSCPPARCPEVLDISASASGLARCCRELGRAAT